MKNKFFIFAIIILLTATIITIVSCKKDKPTEDVTKNVNLAENNNVDNMDAYLLSFKEKLQNATKGGETISVEQAQRDLGNLLNFDFGDANYASDTFLLDTLHVKLQQVGGMVDLSVLAETYSDAFDQILTSYRSLDLPDKSVYSILCKYNNANNKNNDSEDVDVVVTYRGFGGDISYPITRILLRMELSSCKTGSKTHNLLWIVQMEEGFILPTRMCGLNTDMTLMIQFRNDIKFLLYIPTA